MASIPFVIPAGQTESQAVNIGISKAVGVIVDPNWTAAGLSVLGSKDGVTFYSIEGAGNESVQPINPNRWAKLEGCDFGGATYIKLQSGSVTSGLVPQTQTVTLALVTK